MQSNAQNIFGSDKVNPSGSLFFPSELTKSVSAFEKAHILSVNALKITAGVGFGEELSQISDFVLGDIIKANRNGASMPVHFVEFDTDTIVIELAHSTSIERVIAGRKTARLTLMSEYSQIIRATLLETQEAGPLGTLLLLDQWMDNALEHSIIEVSQFDPGSS